MWVLSYFTATFYLFLCSFYLFHVKHSPGAGDFFLLSHSEYERCSTTKVHYSYFYNNAEQTLGSATGRWGEHLKADHLVTVRRSAGGALSPALRWTFLWHVPPSSPRTPLMFKVLTWPSSQTDSESDPRRPHLSPVTCQALRGPASSPRRVTAVLVTRGRGRWFKCRGWWSLFHRELTLRGRTLHLHLNWVSV